MKICQPTENEQGTNNTLHGHFRSAPRYFIYDTETSKSESFGNERKVVDRHYIDNIDSLSDHAVDVAIVGGLGKCALSKMKTNGIKVFRAITPSLDDNIKSLKKGELTELTFQNTRRGRFC